MTLTELITEVEKEYKFEWLRRSWSYENKKPCWEAAGNRKPKLKERITINGITNLIERHVDGDTPEEAVTNLLEKLKP